MIRFDHLLRNGDKLSDFISVPTCAYHFFDTLVNTSPSRDHAFLEQEFQNNLSVILIITNEVNKFQQRSCFNFFSDYETVAKHFLEQYWQRPSFMIVNTYIESLMNEETLTVSYAS